MKTVVCIGTYNEAEHIARILQELWAVSVIIVDDSSDNTGEIARSFPNTTVHERPVKMGYGSAYRKAFELALETGAEWIGQMAGDWEDFPEDMLRLLSLSKRFDADLVLARRAFGWHWRDFFSRGAAFLMRLKGVKVPDATYGFRVWKADLLREVLPLVRNEQYAFNLEMLYHAWPLMNLVTTANVPCHRGSSTWRWWTIWDGLRAWWNLGRSRT